MSPDALLVALLRAWDRAVAVAGAMDLPREYVNVLLPVMPESAADVLRALRDAPLHQECFLLMDQAPLLGRHARDLFLERVVATALPVSSAEIIAQAATAVAPAERGPFRERALAAIAAETVPGERLGALLAWSRAEPAAAAGALVADALALLPAAAPHALCRAARTPGDGPPPEARAALLARLEALPRADLDPEILLARAALSPPAPRATLAARAVERAHRQRDGAGHYSILAIVALDLVGFAPLQPWFERHLRGLRTERDLNFLLRRVGAHMPPEMLDRAARRARSLCAASWSLAFTLTEVARHHAAGREALRTELRALVARVVGDPLSGHQMEPWEYEELFNVELVRAEVAMAVSAVFEGEERRALQRRALALVEGTDSGVERRYELDEVRWEPFGAVLDPSLHDEAARVAVGLRHRPSALKALGELVAGLPASSRHLALLGLARLADGAPPEGRSRALEALDAAAQRPSRPAVRRRHDDRAADPWTDAEAVALARYTALVTRSAYVSEEELRPVLAALAPAAARRAASVVLGLDPYDRLDAAIALAGCDALGDTAGRDALVAAMLGAPRHHAPHRDLLDRMAPLLESVCGERDAAWSARVAAFFEAQEWDVGSFLDAVAAFAPVLRRLGGAELPRTLAARLRTPLAPTALARPWALAAQGAFDA